jgi:hypothetical protein
MKSGGVVMPASHLAAELSELFNVFIILTMLISKGVQLHTDGECVLNT